MRTIGCRWSDRGGVNLANNNEIQHGAFTENSSADQYYCYIVTNIKTIYQVPEQREEGRGGRSFWRKKTKNRDQERE